MNLDLLNCLLTPKSVAVIGASATPGKIGHSVVKNLKESKYAGAVYPVNLNEKEILGFKCYPSILDIKGSVDAAIITIPAKLVLGVIDEGGRK